MLRFVFAAITAVSLSIAPARAIIKIDGVETNEVNVTGYFNDGIRGTFNFVLTSDAPVTIRGFAYFNEYINGYQYVGDLLLDNGGPFGPGTDVAYSINYNISARPPPISARLIFSTTGNATLSLPEPETWGLMVVGFGLLGSAARRQAATAVRSKLR